jgi:hypothetical protein
LVRKIAVAWGAVMAGVSPASGAGAADGLSVVGAKGGDQQVERSGFTTAGSSATRKLFR